jgi:hypothetical protein
VAYPSFSEGAGRDSSEPISPAAKIQNDSVTVILRSSDGVEWATGSTGRYPGYEVEISKKDLKVLRCNYVR